MIFFCIFLSSGIVFFILFFLKKNSIDRNSSENQFCSANQKVFFAFFMQIMILLIPLFSLGWYFAFGSPSLPSYFFSSFLKQDMKTRSLSEKRALMEVLFYRNPGNVQFVDGLSELYLAEGQFLKAIASINFALALDGENSVRLLRYGLALMGLSSGIITKEAEKKFLDVARLDPENLDAQIFLARSLIQSGRREDAIKLLENFLKKPSESKNQDWRHNLAIIIQELKQSAANNNF